MTTERLLRVLIGCTAMGLVCVVISTLAGVMVPAGAVAAMTAGIGTVISLGIDLNKLEGATRSGAFLQGLPPVARSE